MPLVIADRVRETSTTVGTGTLTLDGAVASYQPFSAIGDGNTVYYTIVNQSANEWEVGIGTYTASGTTLSRDTVLSSSNSNNLVNFSAGTKDVWGDYPAGKAVTTDTLAYPPAIGNTTPNAATFTTLTATGQTSLGGAAGSESFRVNTSGAAGSYLSLATEYPGTSVFRTTGSNVGVAFIGTGTGVFNWATNGSASNIQMRVSHTASAVNYVQVTGAATGGRPTFSAQGSDTQITLDFLGKGSTSGVRIGSNFGLQLTTIGDPGVSTANYIQIQGKAAGSAPILSAQGSDTNIDLALTPKGTGTVIANGPFTATGQTDVGGSSALAMRFVQATSTVLRAAAVGTSVAEIRWSVPSFHTFYTGSSATLSSEGAAQFRVNHTASAVNYVQVTGAATTASPLISAQGSDSNIGLRYAAKGGGGVGHRFFGNASATEEIVRFTSVNGGNAYVNITGGATGTSPVLSVAGSDTNISMAFQSKGTGGISLSTGSTGTNLVNGTTVTALTMTNSGSLYNPSGPTVSISAPTTAGGVQATASVTNMNTSGIPTVVSGGTGYTNGDTLTIAGTGATLTVTGVSGGVITSAVSGNFFPVPLASIPANPASVTGGTGSGATFNVLWKPLSLTITNAGSGYVEEPTVTFSGGGGSGAAAYASVGNTATIKGLYGGGSQIPLQFAGPAGNILQLMESGTTSSPTALVIKTGGSSAQMYPSLTNSDVVFSASGTGAVRFYTGTLVSQQLVVTNTASAVNYAQVTGAATGFQPTISAQGSDANIGLRLLFKGNGGGTPGGGIILGNAAAWPGLAVQTVNNPNYFNIEAKAAGSAPVLSTQGSDTNIGLNLTTKGTGALSVNTGNGLQLRVNDTFGTVASGNWWEVSGRGAGAAPLFGVAGETNTSAIFYVKGTGAQRFATGAGSDNGNGAVDQFRITHTASAVNYVQVTGAVTGSGPIISAQGSDANVDLVIASKGTKLIRFRGGATTTQMAVFGTSGAVNYLQATGGIASSAPILSVDGTDTNIDLALTPKGTGNVCFGTYTGTALTIAGYIEIKDSSGTIRKLAVVA